MMRLLTIYSRRISEANSTRKVANTQIIKTKIEPFVREWLKHKFNQPFFKMELPLRDSDAVHEFDAVSLDRKVVAGIKSASGKTRRQKNPAAKCQGAYAELYFLSLIEADKKFLVLTNQPFYELFKRAATGKVATGIELLYCKLSPELEALMKTVYEDAADEIDRGAGGSPFGAE